tara:strand:+ start:364 stop:1257 length:894 start_codon:yes stop_codon:yes gene_type:complete
MFNNNDFNFSNEEVEILFWIQYWALEKTIKDYRVDKISSLIRSKESTQKKETDTKANKNLWLNEWRLKTVELLQIQNELDATQLETKLQQSNFSEVKISAIMTECLTFNPFYPLEKKDKRFESIELDSKTYLNKLSSILPKKQSELLKGRNAYEDSIKTISNDIGKSNNLFFRTNLNPNVFGSDEATTAIMVGGSIMGYSDGDSSYKTNVRNLSVDEILISCAKLISFLYVYKEPKKEIIRDFCNSSRLFQMDLEEDADEYFLNQSKWKLSKKDGNNLKRKPAILVSFRKHIRTIKG